MDDLIELPVRPAHQVLATSVIATPEPWEIGELPGESWAHAVGYEGFYQVSNMGRIRGVDRIIEIPNWSGKRRRHKGRVLKIQPPRANSFYPTVNLLGRTVAIHIVVGTTFIGPKAPDHVWRHIDDDPLNARASNLGRGTQKQNLADAIRNGKVLRGERNPTAILTETEARAIKALKGVCAMTQLGKRFGVSHCTVNDIHQRRTWEHVEPMPLEEALDLFYRRDRALIVPHLEFVLPTLEGIKHQLLAHGRAAAIYYSNSSCFWTHHFSHTQLYGRGMKCPLGGQIFRQTDWEGWIGAAEDNPQYYGAHGLDAFVAAHHSNCRHPQTGGPFAARTWAPYNAALDAMLEEEKGLRKTAALRV